MRTLLIILPAVGVQHDPRLRHGLKDVHIQTFVAEGHIGETAEIIEFDFDESSPVPRGWMLTPVVTNSQL